MTRAEYQMSAADLAALLDAGKPTPVMYLTGGQPMFNSPRENVSNAWRVLGERMGFDHMTARPIPGKDKTWFSACPQKIESGDA